MNKKLSKFNQDKSNKYRAEAKIVIQKAMIKNPTFAIEPLAKLTGYGTFITGHYYFYFKRHGLKL